MGIGIIGVGVVGKAVADGFQSRGVQVALYDKFKPEYQDLASVLTKPTIFICVPTATMDSGQQDLSPLEDVLSVLSSHKYAGDIVVKCTVLPGTCSRMSMTYGLELAHNPEFLTEKRALEDFMNQTSVLIGASDPDMLDRVSKVYNDAGWTNTLLFDKSTKTEMIKYFHNLFLSVKVSFCNEMFEVCETFLISYDDVLAGTIAIGGIGAGHTKVPGPDGKLGFGGMCFPKDTKAFLSYMGSLGLEAEVLDGTVRGNNRRRKP